MIVNMYNVRKKSCIAKWLNVNFKRSQISNAENLDWTDYLETNLSHGSSGLAPTFLAQAFIQLTTFKW